jgi:5-methylcytosine-specific restriction protein A
VAYIFHLIRAGRISKKNMELTRDEKKIEQVSSAWKNILSSTLTDFSYDSIDLRIKNNNLAEGYELGHICGKFYDINDIPSDKELIQDLQKSQVQ